MPDITESIINRIIKERGINSIQDLLDGNVKPTELQPLFLKTYETFVKKIKATDTIRQYVNNRFVRPCNINQKELTKFDSSIFDSIPDKFIPIEMAPVIPLGTNGSLSKISQKNVLSAVRNVEVIADATIALSLECAKRRSDLLRSDPKNIEEVHLCTSQRCIRLQQFERGIGFTSHFRLFVACTGGRDTGNINFEIENVKNHICVYLDILEKSDKSNYALSEITVSFSNIQITESLIDNLNINKDSIKHLTQSRDFSLFKYGKIVLPETIDDTKKVSKFDIEKYKLKQSFTLLSEIQRRILNALRAKYPNVKFEFNLNRLAGIGYYDALCFKITAKNNSGKEFPLVDGGATDWTQKLLGNKKERFFASGFGSEFFCTNFKK